MFDENDNGAWAYMVMSRFEKRRFLIAGVVVLLVTLRWFPSVSCDEEGVIRPVKVDEHFEKSGVEFQVSLFVEPLRELESSSLQMSFGVIFIAHACIVNVEYKDIV